MTNIHELPEWFVRRIQPNNDGCWLWTGRTHSEGYGEIKRGDCYLKAHRVIWSLLVGPIPDDLVTDHLCRTVQCVNPDHLEIVTVRENTLRGFGPTAENARKTHCIRGHEFTPENTILRLRKGGGRTCIACHRTYNREFARRKKAVR